MRWFFDNNLAPGLAESTTPILRQMLRRDHDTAVHLRDMFLPNAKDHEWLPRLVPPGEWVIVSGDVDIIGVRAEQQAWIASGNTAFFLKGGWTNLAPNIQLSMLALALPKMVAIALEARPPVGYLVPLKGNVFRKIY